MSYWLPWAQNSFLLLGSYSSQFSISIYLYIFLNLYIYAVDLDANSQL